MSWGAVAWAKTWRGDLTPPQRFVLFLIAEHFNEAQGRAWPSTTTLAELTGHDRRTISRAVLALEQAGLIVRDARDEHAQKVANRYALPLYRSTAPVDSAGESAVENVAWPA